MSYAAVGSFVGLEAAMQPYCSVARMVYDPRTMNCALPNGKFPPTQVPLELAWPAYWKALQCTTVSGGYPRSTGLPDRVRAVEEVGCCRGNAELFCDDWIWKV